MCGITFFKVGQYVSEGCGSKANQITGMKFLIEIRFRKPKEGQLNIGPPVLPGTNRIGLCQQMSFVTITKD